MTSNNHNHYVTKSYLSYAHNCNRLARGGWAPPAESGSSQGPTSLFT